MFSILFLSRIIRIHPKVFHLLCQRLQCCNPTPATKVVATPVCVASVQPASLQIACIPTPNNSRQLYVWHYICISGTGVQVVRQYNQHTLIGDGMVTCRACPPQLPTFTIIILNEQLSLSKHLHQG